jgi:hypothetical protein
MQRFEELLAKAQAQIPGNDANRALWEVREAIEAEFASAVCYEMVLGPSSVWQEFLDVQLPRLTEHLLAKGLPLLGGPNVVLSVWRGSTMFMFGCSEFFDAIAELEHISRDELRARINAAREALGLSNSTKRSAAEAANRALTDMITPAEPKPRLSGLMLAPPPPAKDDPNAN